LNLLPMPQLHANILTQRNFHFFSILGFTCILMSTWETQLGTALFTLQNGGTAGSIYIYLITVIGFIFAIISMAEMASQMPTSGGQYHWVSELAPKHAQKILSYFVGWLCVLGWQAGVAASSFLAAAEILSLAVLNHEGYVYKAWHPTLLTFAILAISLFVNTVLVRRLPLIEGAMLVIHIVGFIVIVAVLWSTSTHAPSHDVWTQFNDGGGWHSLGLSTLVGILGPVVSLIGPDAACHMSEELKNASKSLPRAMAATAIFNGSLGFIMMITFLYCIGDVSEVTSNPQIYPFIAVVSFSPNQ
jgi:choline transport protein